MTHRCSPCLQVQAQHKESIANFLRHSTMLGARRSHSTASHTTAPAADKRDAAPSVAAAKPAQAAGEARAAAAAAAAARAGPRVFYLPSEAEHNDSEAGWGASSKALRSQLLGSARGSAGSGPQTQREAQRLSHGKHMTHPGQQQPYDTPARAGSSEREWWGSARRIWANIEASPVIPEYIATLFKR